MCNKDFTHLHVHSHYSIQDALPTPEKLILGAKAQGFSSIALTDHGKMAGHFEFAESAHKNGIKPILGCEFYLAKNRYDKSTTAEDGSKKGREKLSHLTVLAQNRIGYQNMLQLGYEASNPDCYYYFPRIDFEYLAKYNEGLIVLSGCLASELNQALLKGNYDDGLKVAKKYKEVFGDRYFIELQYHGIEEQKHNLPSLVKMAKELDIRTVASNDVHYVEAVDWKLHDVLIQMKDLRDDKGTNKATNGKKEAYGSHQFWLKSYEEMSKIFGEKAPDSISNTKLIEEMVEDYYQVDLPHMLPEAKIATEDAGFQKFWTSKLEHHESKEAYLAYQAMKGLKDLGLADKPEYVKRLKYEIETVWYMGVTDYFLIQKEMVDFMKENDILYGIRGSGVGSLLNYSLGISLADPIKFGLMFERFLNPGRGNQYKIDLEDFVLPEDHEYNEIECLNWAKLKCKEFLSKPENSKYESRVSREMWILENQKYVVSLKAAFDQGFTLKNNYSNFFVFYILGLIDQIPAGDLIIKKVAGLPDIDTDIDDSRRHEVIEWAKRRFGEDNVKSVGTWGTYKAKAAILGTLKTSDKFKKQYSDNLAQMALKISGTIPSKVGTTIESAIHESEDFSYWAKKFPEETKNASNLNGVISNLGVHAAAVVISSRPIHQVVPIENSKGTLATAFDMKNVERTGIIKFDLLGLATYRQLSLAIKQIKKRHNVSIDLRKIPLDDEKVLKNIFSKGNTVSVFQFSGPGMQKWLKEVKASTMDDLIAVAALYRPGPMDFIPDYAKGKFKPESIKYAHPIIEKHLAPTYGIMVYQEQAMFLSREMANLDWLEVDKLRKGIAKKEGKQFDEACENFATKSLQRSIPEQSVHEVMNLMKKFGGYAFNKSHSCMYAIVGYWTAYLKYYYPSEWMSACIEADKDDTDKVDIYMAECERLNVKIMPPNVNESDLITNVSQDGTIYLPITSLKGVGNSGSSIVENQPYTSLDDFLERSGTNKSLFVALTAGGALNCLVSGEEVDDDYLLDFWELYSKNKVKTKKANVNNNSLSLLTLKQVENNSSHSGSSLLDALDEL
jgi:DNA polymerase-3 subunit alpha